MDDRAKLQLHIDDRTMKPLAILAQLRVQTAKASKGMSLSVRSSTQSVGEGERWEGVVPSGIPGQNQLLKQHDFTSEEAGILRKQVENLAVRPVSANRQPCGPARPKTSYVQSKVISMNVLDPNEWERIGRQVCSSPRPRSSLPRNVDKPKQPTQIPNKVEDWRVLLRKKVHDSKGPEQGDDRNVSLTGDISHLSFESKQSEYDLNLGF